MFDVTKFYQGMYIEVVYAVSGSCLKEMTFLSLSFILLIGQSAHMRNKAGSGILDQGLEAA